MPKRSAEEIERLKQQAQKLYRQGRSLFEISEQMSIPLRTLNRWGITKPETKLCVLPSVQPQVQVAIEQGDQSNQRLDELYGLSLKKIEQILVDPDSRPRDILSAARLVLETRRSSFTWPSNIGALNEVKDHDLARLAMREALMNAVTASSVQGAVKGLIEVSKLPPPVEERTSLKDQVAQLDNLSDEQIRQKFRELTGS